MSDIPTTSPQKAPRNRKRAFLSTANAPGGAGKNKYQKRIQELLGALEDPVSASKNTNLKEDINLLLEAKLGALSLQVPDLISEIIMDRSVNPRTRSGMIKTLLEYQLGLPNRKVEVSGELKLKDESWNKLGEILAGEDNE